MITFQFSVLKKWGKDILYGNKLSPRMGGLPVGITQRYIKPLINLDLQALTKECHHFVCTLLVILLVRKDKVVRKLPFCNNLHISGMINPPN